MLVTMFYTCLYEYFTEGPMVPPLISDAENCRESWWTNLLMINNLVNTDQACMSWTWYIPMVFQLHIITPIILVPLCLNLFAGIIVIALLFLTNIAVTAMVSIKLYENFGFGEWYYDFVMVPWTKAGPYLVGVVLGIALYRLRDRKIKIPKVVTILCWLGTIAMITAIALSSKPIFGADVSDLPMDASLFAVTNFQLSKTEAVLLRTLGHTAWGLGVAWMIFSSETGHGGYLRSFLRWKAFGPLSKMSFMAFLVSAIMIIRNTLVQVSLIYVTMNNMLYFLVGNILISMIVGLALGMVFQHPFIGIAKALSFSLTKREAFRFASSPLDDEEPRPRTSTRSRTSTQSAGSDSHPKMEGKDNAAYAMEQRTPPPRYEANLTTQL